MLSIPQNRPQMNSVTFNGTQKFRTQKLLKLAKDLKCNYISKILEEGSIEHINVMPMAEENKAFIEKLNSGSTGVWEEIKLITEKFLEKISK